MGEINIESYAAMPSSSGKANLFFLTIDSINSIGKKSEDINTDR